MNLVYVHGRSQQGKNPADLLAEWESALDKGLAAAALTRPSNLSVAFPYYGDEMDRLVEELNAPLIDDVLTKGSAIDSKQEVFEAQLALELARNAGLSQAEIENELPPGFITEKGPLQWGWVHAILKALDKRVGIGDLVLNGFTRDVFVYLTYPAVSSKIDSIVASTIQGTGPCVVVAHSLGSIVAYRVLQQLKAVVDVRGLVTVGSPLGLNAVRNHLPLPLSMPQGVAQWVNAFDRRDVVALLPLDSTTWDIAPPITNFGEVDNWTDNRHGIAGYLDDQNVARAIMKFLS